MERWWNDPENTPVLWDHPGYALERVHHLPVPDRPAPEPARLNTLVWPTGASRWPVLHGLVGGVQAGRILDAVGRAAPAPKPLTVTDGNGGTIFPSMHLLHLKPVFNASTDPAETLWLMTLVGPAYFWWTRQLTYTFLAGDTWATLLTNLVTAAAGLTPTVPAVDAVFGSPNPLRWSAPARPLPPLIDAAAASVGFRFVQNLDGTVKYVTPAAANTADSTQYDTFAAGSGLAAGGRNTVGSMAGQIPANVACGFWGDAQHVETVSLASLALPEFVTDATATTPSVPITGVANTWAWVMMDQRAGSVVPSPAAAARAMAILYYRWLLSQTDAVFRGVVAWQPTGQEDRVEWEHAPGIRDTVDGDPREPNDRALPWNRVVTRVCPQELADKNQYGDRPPPGYVYGVRLTGNSGGAWKAVIRVADATGTVIDGPELGFGATGQYVLRPVAAAPVPRTGDYAVAVPDPLTPYSWLFVVAQAGSGGGGDCPGSCSWLGDLGTDAATPCLLLKLRGGFGRCGCFPSNPTSDDSGIVLVFDGTGVGSLGAFVGQMGRDALGHDTTTAMPNTCCGCGVAQFAITSPGALTASLTFSQVHTSCQSGSGGGAAGRPVFTLGLVQLCCGTDPDTGRRYVTFWGKGPDPCSGAMDPCDNTFLVRVECRVECPAAPCDCDICLFCCAENSTPLGFYALGVNEFSGFADNRLNGSWAWAYDKGSGFGPCTWSAPCAATGTTSTLQIFRDNTATGGVRMRLTHGGNTYEAEPAQDPTWRCGGPVTLGPVTPDPGVIPGSVTVRGTRINNQTCCDNPLPTALTMSLTGLCSGAVSMPQSGLPQDFAYASTTPFVYAPPCCPGIPPGETWTAVVNCTGPSTFAITLSGPTGSLTGVTYVVRSLKPVLITFSGTVTCGGSPPASFPVTGTITE